MSTRVEAKMSHEKMMRVREDVSVNGIDEIKGKDGVLRVNGRDGALVINKKDGAPEVNGIEKNAVKIGNKREEAKEEGPQPKMRKCEKR